MKYFDAIYLATIVIIAIALNNFIAPWLGICFYAGCMIPVFSMDTYGRL